MVLAFLTLFLTEEIGFGEAGAGRMMSLYGVGAIVGNYMGGKLTNAVGSVRLQIVLLLISAPVYLLIPCCTSWQGIGLSIFLLAVFAEAVRPPNSTAVAQFTPHDMQPRAYALQRMAVNLGVSIGPAIGGYLAERDYFLIFAADAVTTMLGAMSLIYFFGLKRYSKTMSAAQQLAVEENIATKTCSPFRDTNFMIMLGLLLTTNLVFFQMHGMYPLYIRDHFGLSKPSLGKLYAINTVMIVLFEMVLVDYIRDWNKVKVIGWGSFLACLGFGMMPFSPTISFCILSMIVLTVGEMLSFPVMSGWVGQRSQRGDRAMYMSYKTMSFSFAAIFAPTLGGIVYEYNKDLLWYISLAIGVFVLAGYYVLANRIANET